MAKGYYEEDRADLRRDILEAAIADQVDVEQNQLRLELWKKRFSEKSDRKDNTFADGYIRVIMSMKYSSENVTGWFGTKGVVRELRKELKKQGYYEFLEKGEVGKTLLYGEWKQAFRLYYHICTTDKNYTSAFMGMINISPEKVDAKIAKDAFDMADYLPDFLNMREELDVLSSAARDALRENHAGALPIYEGMVSEAKSGNTKKKK